MDNIWKKWITVGRGIRIIFVFLYLLATSGMPLSHTCRLADNGLYHCRSGCSACLLHNNEHVKTQPVAVLKRNDITETAKSQNHCCLACLYSLISKAPEICSSTSLCSTQTVVEIQILPQLNFIRQFEWFRSSPLRGPPHIIS